MKSSDRLLAASGSARRLFRAPGRVNIIGEHTDYSDGLVLPVNTGLYTWVAARPRDDREVRVATKTFGESDSFDLDDIAPGGDPNWTDYIRGVARELENAGAKLIGADLSIDGDVPIGGGLSSSASLELALASALLGLADQEMPATQAARVCQLAEQRYAAVNCGIMDQFSVACGRKNRAMLLDCRSLETQFVRLPDDLALIVTDSGVKHALPGSDYNDRHDECRQAVQVLNAGNTWLRNQLIGGYVVLGDRESFEREKERLGNLLYRRSRHVVSEIARVHEAFTALEIGDLARLGELVRASHASLRDDFEVSCDEIERLVEIADACEGVLGSRMVGGGFGGCVLSVARRGDERGIMSNIADTYGKILGSDPWIHAVTPAFPAGEVTTT